MQTSAQTKLNFFFGMFRLLENMIFIFKLMQNDTDDVSINVKNNFFKFCIKKENVREFIKIH